MTSMDYGRTGLSSHNMSAMVPCAEVEVNRVAHSTLNELADRVLRSRHRPVGGASIDRRLFRRSTDSTLLFESKFPSSTATATLPSLSSSRPRVSFVDDNAFAAEGGNAEHPANASPDPKEMVRPNEKEVTRGIVQAKLRQLEGNNTTHRQPVATRSYHHRPPAVPQTRLYSNIGMPPTDAPGNTGSTGNLNGYSAIAVERSQRDWRGYGSLPPSTDHRPTMIHVTGDATDRGAVINNGGLATRGILKGVMNSNGTQTEMFISADGQSTLLSHSNYMANMHLLLAELDASKDLNEKLGRQLTRAEGETDAMRVGQSVQNDRIEAAVASKVADAVVGLQNSLMMNSPSSSLSPATSNNSQAECTHMHHKSNPIAIPQSTRHLNGEPSYDEVRRAIEEMCTEREIWMQKNQSLVKSLEAAERDITVLRSHEARQCQKNAATSSIIEEGRGEKVGPSADWKCQVDELRRQVERDEGEKEELHLTVATLSSKLDEYEIRDDNISSHHRREVEDELRVLNEKHDECAGRWREEQQKSKRINLELAAAKENLATTESRVNGLLAELDTMRGEQSAMNAAEEAELAGKLRMVEGRLAHVTEDKMKLQGDIERMEKEMHGLTAAKGELESENGELKSAAVNAADATRRNEEELRNLLAKKRLTEADLEEANAKGEQSQLRLNGEMESMKKEKDSTEARCLSLAKELAQVRQSMLEDSGVDNKTDNSIVSHHNDDNTVLTRKIDEQKRLITVLRRKLASNKH